MAVRSHPILDGVYTMNGKGDTPRPVNRRKYEKNFSRIEWKSKRCPIRTFKAAIYDFISHGKVYELRGGYCDIDFDGTRKDLRKKMRELRKHNKQAFEEMERARKQ